MNTWQKRLGGTTAVLGGIALCAVGLWLLLSPAQYRATTWVRIEPEDDFGWNGLSLPPPWKGYDPIFLKSTFETIQSPSVLSNLITNLKLKETWGKKYAGGKQLDTTEVISIMRQNLVLAPVRGAKLITLDFTCSNPHEAAQIANAIAQAYLDYRIDLFRQRSREDLDAFLARYQSEGQQISMLQTNLEQLRLIFGIQDSSLTNGVAEPQIYWDQKRRLYEKLQNHKRTAPIIEMWKNELQIPITGRTKIINLAEPFALPIGPNRPLGAVLLVLGLFSCAVGWRWLQASACPPHAR